MPTHTHTLLLISTLLERHETLIGFDDNSEQVARVRLSLTAARFMVMSLRAAFDRAQSQTVDLTCMAKPWPTTKLARRSLAPQSLQVRSHQRPRTAKYRPAQDRDSVYVARSFVRPHHVSCWHTYCTKAHKAILEIRPSDCFILIEMRSRVLAPTCEWHIWRAHMFCRILWTAQVCVRPREHLNFKLGFVPACWGSLFQPCHMFVIDS